MKTIYVCTGGVYSDYDIYGVFDDKKLADAFAEKFAPDCEVEEYPLNMFKEEIESGHDPYFVRMTKCGEAEEVKRCFDGFSYTGKEDGQMRFDVSNGMMLHCFARDKTHAIKIANERRAALIAANQWPEVQP